MRNIKLFIWFAQIRLPFWQTFPLHLLRNKNCLQIRWVPSVVCRASNFFAHFEQAARQCKGRKDCFLRKEELGEELVGASDSSSEIFSPDWRVSPRFQVDSYDWFVCFQTFCTSLAQCTANSKTQTKQIPKVSKPRPVRKGEGSVRGVTLTPAARDFPLLVCFFATFFGIWPPQNDSWQPFLARIEKFRPSPGGKWLRTGLKTWEEIGLNLRIQNHFCFPNFVRILNVWETKTNLNYLDSLYMFYSLV